MTPEEEAKAKSKAGHRWSMIVTGLFMALCGGVGGWIYWSGRGDLPSFMYGPQRQGPLSATRRAKPGLVKWKSWGKDVLGGDKLILLDLRTTWSRAAALMEETTYSNPEVAEWLEQNVVAVRVDADERPDLALRYLSGGWPTTALLLPTGEILDAGTYMTPRTLLPWAKALEEKWRTRRQDILDGAKAAAELRARLWEDRGRAAEPAPAPARPLWDAPPYFPHWRAGPPAEVGKLEDPEWGGFYRYAAGQGWTRPETEKRLVDQAEAVLYDKDEERRSRTAAYVKRFLADPQGGWYNAQAPEVRRADGHVVEGHYYFTLPAAKREALGVPEVDKRKLVGPNAAMARALGDAKALEGLKATGRLGEDVALAHAYAALGQRGKAKALVAKLEKELDAPGAPALFDRPALGELPEGLDRLLVPQLNAQLLELYQAFPDLDAEKRAPKLLRWLAARSGEIDPALWRALVSKP